MKMRAARIHHFGAPVEIDEVPAPDVSIVDALGRAVVVFD